jgi:tRNA (guanine37-N1)-methyltransferase
MKIDILTLFPAMFKGPFEESILKRAQEKGLVEIKIHNLRDWAVDKHGTVDDRPYGGGAGMILMIEPIHRALKDLRPKTKDQRPKTILLTPQGQVFNQKMAKRLSKLDHLILICGHYEGVDERVREHLVDEEISIGDYVLTGGEIPVMVITDTIVRLIPGVLEKPEAIKNESFSQSLTINHQPLLEYPQYTRPEKFKSWSVPKVLLSGHHLKIKKWRKKKGLERTKKRRPELL